MLTLLALALLELQARPVVKSPSQWAIEIRPFDAREVVGTSARYWVGVKRNSDEPAAVCLMSVSYFVEDSGAIAEGAFVKDFPHQLSSHACSTASSWRLVLPHESYVVLVSVPLPKRMRGRSELRLAVSAQEGCISSAPCQEVLFVAEAVRTLLLAQEQ